MKTLTNNNLENISGGGFAAGYCSGFAAVAGVAALAATNPVTGAAIATAMSNPAIFIWAFGSFAYCAGYGMGKW